MRCSKGLRHILFLLHIAIAKHNREHAYDQDGASLHSATDGCGRHDIRKKCRCV